MAAPRAGIDVAYSTGFSPHQIMSFTSPLGVGMCSYGGMDIDCVQQKVNPDEIAGIRKRTCVQGIEK